MVFAHRAALVSRFVQRREHARLAARAGNEVVPFIRAHPMFGQGGSGRVLPVLDVHGGLDDCRVIRESRTEGLAVPGPGAFRRYTPRHAGVDGDKTAAALDETLERRLLFLVQDVARGAEEI